MATLPKRLQIQGACAQQSQQHLSIYGKKKVEFSSSLMSLRTLTISFSNGLLPGQGKWRCAHTISIFLKK